MEEASVVDIKIKPEIESSDESSVGSDVIYSMTETAADIITQQEEAMVIRAEPGSAAEICEVKMRKRGRRKRSFLTPTVLVKECNEDPEDLCLEDALLNLKDEKQSCSHHEHDGVLNTVPQPGPSRRGRKKKVKVTEVDDVPMPEHPKGAGCRFCASHGTKKPRARKRGRPGERSLKCKLCSMILPNSIQLRKHERAHSAERRLKCHYCARSFLTVQHMREHERSHSGERPFKCQYCNKGFTTAGGMRVHERTHTGERPFKCKLCKKTFATSGVLRAHIRYHTGERPFECKICPKAFAESGHLRRHERTHADNRTLHLHKDLYFVL